MIVIVQGMKNETEYTIEQGLMNYKMECFELHIDTSPMINRANGRFLKNHVPFNKDVPMTKWMDVRKIKKVLKNLELGRPKGNTRLAGANKIAIVGIKDGKLYPFKSSVDAANILKAKGVKVSARNIRYVCREKASIVGGREYIRRHAGGLKWFIASEVEKYKEFLR